MPGPSRRQGERESWIEAPEAPCREALAARQELQEGGPLLGLELGDVADEVSVLGRVLVEAVLRSDVPAELLLGLPLRLAAAYAADDRLKLSLLAAGVGERGQRSYREDGVEAFSECLHLDFDGFEEHIV